MELDEQWLSLEGMSDLVGVPVRTIRYYIAEGLLPGPGSRGKGATYTADHLARLRLVRLLVERRVPLAEIREQTASLSSAEVRALLEEEQRGSERVRTERSRSPKDYVSSLLAQARAARPVPSVVYAPSTLGQTGAGAVSEANAGCQTDSPDARAAEAWHRWELAPGLELHVRSDAREQYSHFIERLLGMAGLSVGGPRNESKFGTNAR